MSFILYLLFVIFVISSSQPYDDNEFYDEAEQYEELLQPESSFQKPKAPHHPGSNPKNIIPNRNMEIPPEIRQAHPHMNPRMNQRNPNMMNNHQFHNVPPNRQHMPNSRAGEFQEGPLGHQGPMNMNGHNRRHNGPNIPPSQTYHSTPQQTYSTNTNTNNSWYSGTFGTIYEIMMILSENLEVFMELFNNKNLFPYYKQIEPFLDVIYFTDQSSFCKEPFAVFFSFNINLTYSGQERRLLEITHFVNLFVDTLAQLKYSAKFKNEVKNNRIRLERTKMEEGKRKEIEDKEKQDCIEKWKIKNKLKNKKGAERKRLMKELEKYE